MVELRQMTMLHHYTHYDSGAMTHHYTHYDSGATLKGKVGGGNISVTDKSLTKNSHLGNIRVSGKVKDFIRRGLLDEYHLEEIGYLSAADNLSPWLTTEQAWGIGVEKGGRNIPPTLALMLRGYKQCRKRFPFQRLEVIDD